MKELERYLKLDLPVGQSAFLWGPRKSGKSTFLKQHFPDSIYYDLLDSELYFRFADAPYLLRQEIEQLATNKRLLPVIIDEFQKVPLLLDEVHLMIEKFKPISFILCGSSARKLRRSGANLLGGRAWRCSFFPLVFPELKDFDLLNIFRTGLIPSHYLNPSSASKSIKSYIADYLTHEIQFEGSVRNLRAFIRFLDIMAYSHGEVISFANIARDCAVDAKTVKGYFDILQDMMLGFFLYPYSSREGRSSVIAHPKFYFFDVGIAGHLARRKIEELKGAEAGKALEHYLFCELQAYQQLNDLDFKLGYWRTRYGNEVDFVLGEGEIAVESKLTSLVQKRDLQGLIAFHNDFPNAKLYVVSLEPRPRLMTVDDKKIQILPVKSFLEDLWARKIIC
jgi:predicted AAA+ superfamily ATPase